MLQQTQVATVLPYYKRFVAAFPTSQRSPRRRSTACSSNGADSATTGARIICMRPRRRSSREHGGAFPRDAATLATLPGIGRSTAAAIAAFAFGERGAILDGNVKRVLARHRGDRRVARRAERRRQRCGAVADALLPDSRDIEAYTQGMMDLGATVCTRTRPRCDVCPVHDDCIARLDRTHRRIACAASRKALPQRAVTRAVIERDGDVLLEKRPALGIWGGLWSLPELPRETDVPAYVGVHLAATTGTLQWLPPLTHGFTHFALTMHPVRVEVLGWPLDARMPGVEWFARDAALAAAIPSPIRKLLRIGDASEFRLTG